LLLRDHFRRRFSSPTKRGFASAFLSNCSCIFRILSSHQQREQNDWFLFLSSRKQTNDEDEDDDADEDAFVTTTFGATMLPRNEVLIPAE
jgi:hypothetical protein